MDIAETLGGVGEDQIRHGIFEVLKKKKSEELPDILRLRFETHMKALSI